MRMFSKLALALALSGAALAAPASAHLTLVSASPAANASASAATTKLIVLKFSDTLTPQQSGAALIMTGMPGMANHPYMKIPGVTASIGADGKSLELSLAKPLPVGTYRIDWYVVGSDTHRVTGQHSFSIG
ncbi:copper resistance protein CopC [Sphingomonas sp. 37zxx]|uniref:copper resistance protein CopC n=1 Tax=Sphingomonas sp. 37zxx TaxID=1550073 RepID=UPI00053BF219|nr:copper resistance protein CopC [Sphingomonas sp. 37zxx]